MRFYFSYHRVIEEDIKNAFVNYSEHKTILTDAARVMIGNIYFKFYL